MHSSIPLCRADVKGCESSSKRAQHSSPGGEGLQASSAAESLKSAAPSSHLQSADVAVAPAVVVTPPLAPHSHAQPVTLQQAAASKASPGRSTAAEQLSTPTVKHPYTGAAAVSTHSIPAQLQHLFPSVSMHLETSKCAEKLPKQLQPPLQSLSSYLPLLLSPIGGEPKCADKNADGYVRAADKAVDGQTPF